MSRAALLTLASVLLCADQVGAQAAQPDAGAGAAQPDANAHVAPSAAQADAAREPTLDDVLSSVRRHHPLVAAERLTVRAAEADMLAARGEFDTLLSAQGRVAAAGYYDPKRVDVLLEQPTPLWGASVYAGYRIGRGNIAPYYGEQRTLSAGEVRGGVRVPILQDGAIDGRRAAIRSSSLQRTASEQGYRKLQLDLQRDAAAAYYSYRAAGLRLRVLESLVGLAELRDTQIAEKVALGALPSVEALDNRRSVLERRRQRVLARRGLEKAAIDLSLFLRDESGKPVVLASASGEPLEDPRLSVMPLAQALQRAYELRPELSQAEAQLELSSVERELASNRVLPRLDAFAEGSRDFGHGRRELEPTLQPTAVELGATLNVPLWLRKARGKLRAAEAKLEAGKQKLSFARDKINAEVLDAFSQWQAAQERVQMARDAASAAAQVASGERERFELGATTILFVNLREQTAADAQMALIDAQAEAAFATVRVQLVTGEPLVVSP